MGVDRVFRGDLAPRTRIQESGDLRLRLTGDTINGMRTVTVRELRNNGGRVLQRVASGESLTVTLDGQPVAELRPIPGRALPAATLLARWRRLPAVDRSAFRKDIDRVIDASI